MAQFSETKSESDEKFDAKFDISDQKYQFWYLYDFSIQVKFFPFNGENVEFVIRINARSKF